MSGFNTEKGRLDNTREALKNFVEGRRDSRWLEVLKAINDCLPRDLPTGADSEKDPALREQISLVQISNEHAADVATWHTQVLADQRASLYLSPFDKDPANAPTGEGYIFSLHGIHYHHEEGSNQERQGVLYVRDTLLKNLQSWTVTPLGTHSPQPVGQLGIKCPTIRMFSKPIDIPYEASKAAELAASRVGNTRPAPGMRPKRGARTAPGATGSGGSPSGYPGGGDSSEYASGSGTGPGYPGSTGYPQPGVGTPGQKSEDVTYLKQTHFVIQFVWQYVPEAERLPNPPSAVSEAATGDVTTSTDGSVPADSSVLADDAAATDPAAEGAAEAVPPDGTASPPDASAPPAKRTPPTEAEAP